MKILTAFYDLRIGPVSYDIVQFMVNADMARVRVGADKLHVVIVPFADGVDGMFRDKLDLYSAAEMRWRLWNIVIPACALIGAGVTLAGNWDHACMLASKEKRFNWPDDWREQSFKKRPHMLGAAVDGFEHGEKVPKLKSSSYADSVVKNLFNGRNKTVTMTLRGTKPALRNSDELLWRAYMVKEIQSVGFDVVILDDTSKALEHGAGFFELNVDLRMACYQNAHLNILPNGGPASLCVFSDVPYLFFDAGDHIPGWKEMMIDQGVPYRKSPPWANEKQRFVYGKITRELVSTSIHEFL